MAKPKYSPETKLAVVNHYLSGKDGEQIAVALTLLDENARLTRENRLLQQRLARFLAHG